LTNVIILVTIKSAYYTGLKPYKFQNVLIGCVPETEFLMKEIKPIEKIRSLFDRSRAEKLPANIPLMLRSRAQTNPDLTLQVVKNEIGEFEYISYRRVYNRVVEMACALKKAGIKRGDLVGFMSDNRREWMILDEALLSLGAADVPRGCDSTGTEMSFILNFVKCEICIFENQRQLLKVLECEDKVSTLRMAILIDSPDENVSAKAAESGIKLLKYVDLEDQGHHASDAERKDAEAEMDRTTGDELATIIFTSGTTGTPKGVMLTHDNYIAQCEVVRLALPNVKDGDIWLSVLPVWHSFERAFQYFFIALKAGVAYSKPAAANLLGDMAKVHPTWMCGVPRLWESLAHGIFRKMKKENKVTRFSFNLAIRIGKIFSWSHTRVCGLVCRFNNGTRFFDFIYGIIPFILTAPLYGICKLVIFRKIKAVLGGRMVAAISGGGALQADVDSFYHAIGFNLLEGYGITEAGPVLSVRNPLKPRSGCVGVVYPAADVKVVALNEDGTVGTDPLPPGKKGIIMAHGRQIMKGYYTRPDLTAQVIDRDGWLNTGDIGMMTADNEIKITGRQKDTIVLLGGENIEPAVIEAALLNSPYIERAMIVGQDKKYIAALIVPAKDAVTEWANESRVMYDSWESLLASNEVQMMFREEIESRVSEKTGFRTCERISRFTLLPQSFETGREVNAKGEMMRFKIRKIYEKQIKKMFASPNSEIQ
jgi:long-chain acyl-CoA synthetase